MPELRVSTGSRPSGYRIKFEDQKASSVETSFDTLVPHFGLEPTLRDLFVMPTSLARHMILLGARDSDDSQVAHSYAERFERLARSWKESIGPTSSIHKMSMHSSYQQIIAMGYSAVSLILEDLQREPNHWFWALRAITGADPVQIENQGNIREMANDWLTWGRSHGYISRQGVFGIFVS